MTVIIFVRHGESDSNVFIHQLDEMRKLGHITKELHEKSQPELSRKIINM